MKSTIRAMVAALAATPVLALAACGSGISSSPAPTPSAAIPAAPAPAVNPVPILRQTGADVPAGVKTGDHDAFGNRMAEGKFGSQGWEDITVYTAGSNSAFQALLHSADARPDDYTGIVVIPARRAVVSASAWEDNGPHWALGGTPAQIAQRVHGHLAGSR